MQDDELVQCHALRIGHRQPILPPIDVTVRRGELWAVIGRNGSGKTTWFRTLLGLLPALGGRVERRPGVRLAYVPQRSQLDALFPLLVRDVVRMGVDRGLAFATPSFKEPPAVRKALEEAGALDLAAAPFRDLSEGQKQRVLLARLVASDPELALLDEPTAAMDVVAEREALSTLDRVRRERGTTILVVSHHLGVAREIADRAIFLDQDTQTVVVGSPESVLGHRTFRASYGALDVAGADG